MGLNRIKEKPWNSKTINIYIHFGIQCPSSLWLMAYRHNAIITTKLRGGLHTLGGCRHAQNPPIPWINPFQLSPHAPSSRAMPRAPEKFLLFTLVVLNYCPGCPASFGSNSPYIGCWPSTNKPLELFLGTKNLNLISLNLVHLGVVPTRLDL